MLTKFIPIEDALVVRVGSVQDFRDRLVNADQPDQAPCRTVLASIREMFPDVAKVPTIREMFV